MLRWKVEPIGEVHGDASASYANRQTRVITIVRAGSNLYACKFQRSAESYAFRFNRSNYMGQNLVVYTSNTALQFQAIVNIKLQKNGVKQPTISPHLSGHALAAA